MCEGDEKKSERRGNQNESGKDSKVTRENTWSNHRTFEMMKKSIVQRGFFLLLLLLMVQYIFDVLLVSFLHALN